MTLVFWLCPMLSVLLGCLILGSGMGWEPDVTVIVPLVLGILFVAIGNYLPKCTRNYTIGIKIPWTLDSEENWNATHRLAGKLWVAGGILLLPCAFLPAPWQGIAMLVVLLVISTVPVIYSWQFSKEEKASQ
jgi:uncharacterized membrane protein